MKYDCSSALTLSTNMTPVDKNRGSSSWHSLSTLVKALPVVPGVLARSSRPALWTVVLSLALVGSFARAEETPAAPKADPSPITAGKYQLKPKVEALRQKAKDAAAKSKEEGEKLEKEAEKLEKSAGSVDKGDTAWMLMSTGLVMLMTPGLALFYGGLVRRKNVLGTMMHSMVALGLIGVQWVLYGYCLAFGDSQNGLIGWNPALLGLQGVNSDDTFATTNIPLLVHCMYQGMFAIITPALISGALAERIRFGPYCLFVLLWATLVYDPLAHWVWAVNSKGEAAGFLGQWGAIDFAGGTVVHVAAGVSGLAAILALRKRIGYPEHAIHPNSVVLSLVGAGILWFGWFGFNGGSALASTAHAAAALTATQIAAATAALAWVIIEWAHRGKPTGLGLATGLVAGLVAVTPASGFVTPLGAMIIGVAVAALCYAAVVFKPLLKYDDSLDAFGVHGLGGALGAILTGVLASAAAYQASSGLTFLAADGKTEDPTYLLAKLGADGSNRAALITVQVQATIISAVFSFVVTFILVKVIDLTWGFCLDPKAEELGLDRNEHGEVGFDYGGPVLDEIAETPMPEPRAASMPPNGKGRFTIVVEGASDRELLDAWSKLCQTGVQQPAEFKTVYPLLTTVQGNRFRFRGGDHFNVRTTLQRLFETVLNTPVQTHVEE